MGSFNSNSIGNSRATGLSVLRLLCVTLVKQSSLINFIPERTTSAAKVSSIYV